MTQKDWKNLDNSLKKKRIQDSKEFYANLAKQLKEFPEYKDFYPYDSIPEKYIL